MVWARVGTSRRRAGRVISAVFLLAWIGGASALGAEWRSASPDTFRATQIVLDGATGVYAGGPNSAGWELARLDAATGAEEWSFSPAVPNNLHEFFDLAVLGGDVVAATRMRDPDSRFSVQRFDRTTGVQTWDYSIANVSGFNRATALVIAGADVVAVGNEFVVDNDAVVVRIDGATGAQLWRTIVDESSSDGFLDVAIDPAGDVVAGGYKFAGESIVVKLDGTTGGELWRTVTTGIEHVVQLEVDSSGDVIVAWSEFDVAKLDGTTGATIWTTSIDGDGVPSGPNDVVWDLVLTPGGDPVIAGLVRNAATRDDLVVVRLDGSSGAVLWQHERDEKGWDDEARGVAVDSNGDVFVAGTLSRGSHKTNFLALKLDGASGVPAWTQLMPNDKGDDRDQALGVSVDAAGDAYFAGEDGTRRVLAIDGSTGSVGVLHGRKLKLFDQLGRPERRSISAAFVDKALITPEPGSPDDPTVAGATVRLENPLTSESVTFVLPGGASWKGIGNPPGAKGYAYTDKSAAFGPCKTLRVIAGKSLKLTCNAKLSPISYSLDEPSQGELILSVQLGGAPAQCGVFGGTLSFDSGIGNPGVVGRFKAKSALPEGSCS